MRRRGSWFLGGGRCLCFVICEVGCNFIFFYVRGRRVRWTGEGLEVGFGVWVVFSVFFFVVNYRVEKGFLEVSFDGGEV